MLHSKVRRAIFQKTGVFGQALFNSLQRPAESLLSSKIAMGLTPNLQFAAIRMCAEHSALRSKFLESGLRSLENLFPIVADRLDSELLDQKLKDFFDRYASSG